MIISEAADKLRNEIGDDFGIFDIFAAERFGSEIIYIGCISNEDCQRIAEKYPREYEGHQTYISGPIWGIGGLIPENLDKYIRILQGERVAHGRFKDVRRDQFTKIAEEEDLAVWNKWTPEERKKWLRNYILEKRKKDPKFGNCADKFLV